MAYIKDIKSNSIDSHQTSGGSYMLTFIRWANRDLANYTNIEAMELREPMLVVNDCVQLSVNQSKSSHVQSASMVFVAGDVNYSTAVHPGDFVFINMLNDDSRLFGVNGSPKNATSDSLYLRAKNKKAINNKEDGFRGLFKIQQVRRIFVTDPSGIKRLQFQVQALAFTEFNQVIYFNSYLYGEKERQGDRFKLFGHIPKDASDMQTTKPLNLRITFKSLVEFLIGSGFPKEFAGNKEEVTRNHNANFLMPSEIGQMLGIGSVTRAADIYTYYNGIQSFRENASTDAIGMNPIYERKGNFIDCGDAPQGTVSLMGEYWNQTVAWSLINQYINSTLNEMYTTFKLTPENKVLPSVVYRQKPFTSAHFAVENTTAKMTEYLRLPRWRIDPSLILGYTLGKEEVARVNFVQVIGKAREMSITSNLALQASDQSFKIDQGDILRNGLKPYIVSCDFDFPLPKDEGKQMTHSPEWTKLVFDWLNNGHLRESGELSCVGLEEPISVGDNLQIGDIVYHIESISTSMVTAPNGVKSFRTKFSLSFGTHELSDKQGPLYSQMANVDMDAEREYDYNHNGGMLAGVSDDQNVNKKNTRKGFNPIRKKNKKP